MALCRLKWPASESSMICREFLQLEEQYELAVRLWAQYASPQTLVGAGENQLQRATALRQEALTDRNAVAKNLYLHRHGCPVCKKDAMKGRNKARIPTGSSEIEKK